MNMINSMISMGNIDVTFNNQWTMTRTETKCVKDKSYVVLKYENEIIVEKRYVRKFEIKASNIIQEGEINLSHGFSNFDKEIKYYWVGMKLG